MGAGLSVGGWMLVEGVRREGEEEKGREGGIYLRVLSIVVWGMGMRWVVGLIKV